MKTPPPSVQALPIRNVDPMAVTLAEKRQERRMVIFLTVFLAPILAVALVGTYGLIIWLYQLFAGPPSS